MTTENNKCVLCEEKEPHQQELCQECWDEHKEIEYEVEFKVIGTFLDQVYNVDNENGAIDIAMDRLRTDPIRITDKDVDVVRVYRYEIIDHHKIKRQFNKEILYNADK